MLRRLLDVSTRRSDEPELMDDLSIQGEELEITLEEIALLNRTLGGYPPSIEGVRRLMPPGTTEVSVLDVGTGSADVPRRIVDWGRATGVEIRVKGIDLAETTIDLARRRSRSHPEIQVELADLFALPDDEPYDIVHAANVLHHFAGQSATRALARMYALSRWGVVINDLHRHPVAWASAKLLTGLFAESRLVRNDAALSVHRAFTRRDLFELARAAGLPDPEIAWHPMFRWRVLIRRT